MSTCQVLVNVRLALDQGRSRACFEDPLAAHAVENSLFCSAASPWSAPIEWSG